MFSLICAWTKSWANNRDACDLGHRCAHYDVTAMLTHWSRVTHICVGNLTIIGPDNSLSPGRRQAIIWTNAGILLIGPLGADFSEISIEIMTFSFKKIHLKMSSAKMAAICLGLNELRDFATYWPLLAQSGHIVLIFWMLSLSWYRYKQGNPSTSLYPVQYIRISISLISHNYQM